MAFGVMIDGSWLMVYGWRFMVDDVWFMAIWVMVHGSWLMVYGWWFMVEGLWLMV